MLLPLPRQFSYDDPSIHSGLFGEFSTKEIGVLTIGSFLFFTALVGVLTYFMTRKDDHETSSGYFLAGRSLTFPFIAGSLLLTNLSTEQLVGLNGDAFTDGLSVMAWEVWSVLALVMMALYFLPKFLRSGVTTVPEYLELRFDSQTQILTNIVFLLAYMGILLPVVLYTGAKGLTQMLNVQALLGLQDTDVVMGMSAPIFTLVAIVWVVGILGSIYALFGGLKSVAVSDTLNGVGLLIGGFMITYFALAALGGEGGMMAGYQKFVTSQPERFNSVGAPHGKVPFSTLFTGVFLLGAFYWTTNQQIIQRTLGASSLAEGQKGVLLTGVLKLLGPFYLVLPGMLAYTMYTDQVKHSNDAYGILVSHVLPAPLTGFFAAVMVGAILSSFNSALNSTCTLFSLGLYKSVFRPKASDKEIVLSSTIFGTIIAIASMLIAPMLEPAPGSSGSGIFGYLQKMNGMYFIPIFAVVVIGMMTKRVPPIAAKVGLLLGLTLISLGYFVPELAKYVTAMHEFHFLGVVFVILIAVMLLIGQLAPLKTPYEQVDVKAVDMTPWKMVWPASILLTAIVIGIYVYFANLSVLTDAAPSKPDAAVVAPESVPALE